MSRLLLLSAFVVTAACGGSAGPSRPSDLAAAPGAPAAALAIDGWTDRAVGAEISPAQPAHGETVTVSAPGYLTRHQAFDGSPIALWPATESYVDRLVYGWDFEDGARRLVRWERPFTVSLEGPLAVDAEIVARVEEVLADLRRYAGPGVTLGNHGDVTIGVDASLAQQRLVGEANIETRGWAIVSGRIRLVSRDEFLGDGRSSSPHTLLHELGHIVGLSHSTVEQDVMWPNGGARSGTVTFTAEEATSLHMMYAHRKAGNLPVDRDPGLAAASTTRRTFRILD